MPVSIPTLDLLSCPPETLPQYKRTVLGGFSVDTDCNVFNDGRGKKILKMPPRSEKIDLLEGFKLVDHTANRSVRLDSFLEWSLIRLDSESPGSLKSLFYDSQFAANYSTFVNIAKSPYDFDRFERARGALPEIVVVKYKGVLFLRDFEPGLKEQKIDKKEQHIEPPDRELDNAMFVARQGYAGRKFESILTVDGPEAVEKPEGADSIWIHDAYKAVNQFHLQSHTLLLPASVDAFDRDGNAVEILLSRKPFRSEHELVFKEGKALFLYLQGLLTGIEKLVIGFRNIKTLAFQGFHRLRDTKQIPDYVRAPPAPELIWKPEVCLAFLDFFLTQVSETFLDLPDLSYQTCTPDMANWEWTMSTEVPDDRRFLPQWFLDATKTLE